MAGVVEVDCLALVLGRKRRVLRCMRCLYIVRYYLPWSWPCSYILFSARWSTLSVINDCVERRQTALNRRLTPESYRLEHPICPAGLSHGNE